MLPTHKTWRVSCSKAYSSLQTKASEACCFRVHRQAAARIESSAPSLLSWRLASHEISAFEMCVTRSLVERGCFSLAVRQGEHLQCASLSASANCRLEGTYEYVFVGDMIRLPVVGLVEKRCAASLLFMVGVYAICGVRPIVGLLVLRLPHVLCSQRYHPQHATRQTFVTTGGSP